MKCKKCGVSIAAACTMGIWYVLGIIAVMFFPPALLRWMPQIVIAKELAPIADNMELISLLIGLIQIFVMTFLVVWVACGIHCRLEKRK